MTTETKPLVTPWTVYLGFTGIIAFIVIIASVGMIRSQTLTDNLEVVVDQYNPRSKLALQMRLAARERITVLFSAVDTLNAFQRDDILQKFTLYGATFMKAREALIQLDLSDKEQQLLEQHRSMARDFAPSQREVMAMIADQRLAEAREYLVTTVEPNQAKALAVLDEYLATVDKMATAALVEVRAQSKFTSELLMALALLGTLASLGIATFVGRRLRRTLTLLNDARDNLESKVSDRTKELQDANDAMNKLAHYDLLSGLPNRLLFYENLNLYLLRAERHSHLAAVFFIDLDGFKAVNDTYGHEYGDDLLRQVAQRLNDCMRIEDSVSRLGGDEFTITLGDMQESKSVNMIAERVIKALSTPFEVLGADIQISSSIGIAIYPTHANDRDGLLKAADKTMYEVKKSGKNNYRICCSEVEAKP